MIFKPRPLPGAFRIDLEPPEGECGFSCAREFAALGLATTRTQKNTSPGREAGTVRGMHFERPPGVEPLAT